MVSASSTARPNKFTDLSKQYTRHLSKKKKKYCQAAFLDISQAFDRVWYTGLLYKLKMILPLNYYMFIKSYISSRHFYVKQEDEVSSLYEISARVTKGSVLGPLLYLLFTADLPSTNTIIIGTFTDNTAILSVDEDPVKATTNLQKELDNIANRVKK